jgi:hypothetical protein
MGKLRPYDLAAGLGGAVLFVSLFLHWYGFAFGGMARDEGLAQPLLIAASSASVTGWRSFTVIDILLAAIAVLAIAVPLVTAVTEGPAKPVAIAVLATTFTPLAVLLVVFRLIEDPFSLEVEGFELSPSLQVGAWLGLAGALIAFVGSFGALKDESTPGAVLPDVPRRPAPPATAA